MCVEELVNLFSSGDVAAVTMAGNLIRRFQISRNNNSALSQQRLTNIMPDESLSSGNQNQFTVHTLNIRWRPRTSIGLSTLDVTHKIIGEEQSKPLKHYGDRAQHSAVVPSGSASKSARNKTVLVRVADYFWGCSWGAEFCNFSNSCSSRSASAVLPCFR